MFHFILQNEFFVNTTDYIYIVVLKNIAIYLDDIKKHGFLNKNMWQLEKELSQKWA